MNPLTDATGQNCAVGQSGPVWFLAGTFTGSATRTCSVPVGKSLFFPVLNNAFIATEAQETETFVHAQVKATIDAVDVSTLTATIDGYDVPNLASYRAHSPTFALSFPNDNVLGEPAGTYAPVAADGFYLMLLPFHPGIHTGHFGGEFADETVVDVTYHLIVG